jgi:hypothetical protein
MVLALGEKMDGDNLNQLAPYQEAARDKKP